MKNKGYTMIEAVVAMFLVVVMVGAVFSALMSGRRAITASSEKEEILYSLQSAYTAFKDCRQNPNCKLNNTTFCGSNTASTFTVGSFDLRNCTGLFTFGFKNLCQDTDGNFKISISNATEEEMPAAYFCNKHGACDSEPTTLKNFYVLQAEASCD